MAENAISDLESDYLSSSVLNTLVTTADLSAAEYITQSDIDGLSDQISQNTTDILSLQGSVQSISTDYVSQNDLVGLATEDWVNSNAALGSIVSNLADYMSVDTATNTIVINGANLQVQSGSGYTDDRLGNTGALLGLGNVIIGYHENDGTDLRSGSHNLIVGSNHSYTELPASYSAKMRPSQAITPLVWAVKTTSSPVITLALPVDSTERWLEITVPSWAVIKIKPMRPSLVSLVVATTSQTETNLPSSAVQTISPQDLRRASLVETAMKPSDSTAASWAVPSVKPPTATVASSVAMKTPPLGITPVS